MLRKSILALSLACAAALLLMTDLSAQCRTVRGGCGGSLIECAGPPVHGGALRIRLSPSCNTTQNLMLIGAFDPVGIAPGAPPLCSFCAGCRIHVMPFLVQPWVGATGDVFGLPIPGDPGLIGVEVFAQNLCLFPPPANCFCASNTLSVRIV